MIPVYYNSALSFIVLVIIPICINNILLMGNRSGLGVKGADNYLQLSATCEPDHASLLNVIPRLSLLKFPVILILFNL